MPADWSAAPTLTGRRVVLTALTEDHVDGWLAAADDDEVFAHTWLGRPADRAEAAAQVATALTTPSRVAFAQLDAGSGEFLGTTSYYEADPASRSVAIGYTWLARRAQRTGVNREAKLLLLTRAFEELGAVRVVWHTDERNLRSQEAIAALGAVEEGRLRKHRLRRDGTWRTTVQFSMTDEDWPRARRRLTAPRP